MYHVSHITFFLLFYSFDKLVELVREGSILTGPTPSVSKRPGVAGDVIQTPLLLIKSVSQQIILCENIFKTSSLRNSKSWGADILIEGSPPTTCHVSCVTCHLSCVICHMSHVFHLFFTELALGPLRSSSRDVSLYIYLSVPFHEIFLRPWTGLEGHSSMDWCGSSVALA